MTLSLEVEIYQLRVYLREISPTIWRRLLLRSDSTITDLHYTLQIAMGWTDFHLHQFVIRGKRMVKKQQMRWTKKGAHLLLQARTKTLNGELRDTFCHWYPSMVSTVENLPLAV